MASARPVMLFPSVAFPRLRALCPAVAVSLCMSLLAAPVRSAAGASAGPSGTSLLQGQLPVNTAVTQATREQLTRAVTLATRAHRDEAASILTAALTRGTRQGASTPETKLPCAWVAALLHASVAAAPEKASSLLELAGSLYPDCADTLQKVVELFDDKNVVDDKNGPASASSTATNPTAANQGNTDPNGLNLDDPQVRDSNTAGGGFGPGFPGAPGFVGSAPAGGVALPSPVAPSVTPVVND